MKKKNLSTYFESENVVVEYRRKCVHEYPILIESTKGIAVLYHSIQGQSRCILCKLDSKE